MVRACLLILMIPMALIAGEFTATVSKKEISPGESFQLSLYLKDASAKGSPGVASLKNAFSIYSQKQSSNTTIINGKMSSGVTWQLTLLPLKEGEVTIPPVSIETNDGTLSSKPIKILVAKGSKGPDKEAQEPALTVIADVSNANPYKSEPFTYTVKLIARETIANVSMQKPALSDAIVEQLENPRTEEKIVNGMKQIIVQFNFLVTPLKSGSLKIPSGIIQGGIISKRKSRFDSFFEDDYDPFNMMRGFSTLEPFAMAADEIEVQVMPPVAGVSPWLPAISVKIEDSFDDSQKPQAGEPLTRTITTLAIGVSSSQLPALSQGQIGSSSFKVYADTPQLKQVMKNGELRSERKEQYTLIPEKAGSLELPEIQVPWWNVAKQKMEYATVPAITLEVLPAAPLKREIFSEPEQNVLQQQAASLPITLSERDPVLYVLIAILGASLAAAFFWALSLQRKISRLGKGPIVHEEEAIAASLKPKLKELDQLATSQEIRSFLQAWGEANWGLSKNASIDTLFDEIRMRNPGNKRSEIDALEKILEDALYRGRAIPFQEVKESLKSLLAHTKEAIAQGSPKETLPDLNPT